MNKPIDFCPSCKSKRELDLSLGLVTFNNPEGTDDILLYHYHCASCNAYVRSTTLNHEEYSSPGEFVVVSISEYLLLPV